MKGTSVPTDHLGRLRLPSPDEALPGRTEKMPVAQRHHVLDAPLDADFSMHPQVMFGMGCFWGAERRFWSIEGVVTTAVGYAGGLTPNPTYEEVCTGRTGHVEVVRVVFDRKRTILPALLRIFWESHDPTQGMRQGNDIGTQYRSAIYVQSHDDEDVARRTCDEYQRRLTQAGFGSITTEIRVAGPFYFAEGEHQQYLAKNPGGYCGLGGTGVGCPLGVIHG